MIVYRASTKMSPLVPEVGAAGLRGPGVVSIDDFAPSSITKQAPAGLDGRSRQHSLAFGQSISALHARPVAFEALLRWEQHDGTQMTAAQFIDTAEQTGMIVELVYWVMREACAQARRWQETGGDPIITAVKRLGQAARRAGLFPCAEAHRA